MEGKWQDLTLNAQYVRKKKADEHSYAWDRLIEHFSENIAGGTLEIGNDRPLSELELGVRIMASEARLARRSLATTMINLWETTPRDRTKARHVVSSQYPERGYVFLVRAKGINETYEEHRKRRIDVLAAYCQVAKLKTPELFDIVGIAVDHIGGGSSEDLYYFDARNWTEEDAARTRELQEVTGILKEPEAWEVHDNEYPEPNDAFQAPTQHGNRKQRRKAAAEERLRRKRERR